MTIESDLRCESRHPHVETGLDGAAVGIGGSVLPVLPHLGRELDDVDVVGRLLLRRGRLAGAQAADLLGVNQNESTLAARSA
jgi:hypothetical protein